MPFYNFEFHSRDGAWLGVQPGYTEELARDDFLDSFRPRNPSLPEAYFAGVRGSLIGIYTAPHTRQKRRIVAPIAAKDNLPPTVQAIA